jgi:hypothetical protein
VKVDRIFATTRMAGSSAVAGIAAAAVLAATATACSQSVHATGRGRPSPSPPPSPGSPPPPGADLWFGFDRQAQAGSVSDASGNGYDGEIIAGNGGTVRRVAGTGGAGHAVRFPDLCKELGCTQPTAVIRVDAARRLNPGAAPFGFGAAVKVAALSGGANVLQKGNFADRVQWKLQVDRGKPSCVLHARDRRAVAAAPLRLETGRWYDLECRKRDGYIAIAVNGAERARENVTLGRIRNDAPIYIGAKGPGVVDNDQFHGALDNVFVRVAH